MFWASFLQVVTKFDEGFQDIGDHNPPIIPILLGATVFLLFSESDFDTLPLELFAYLLLHSAGYADFSGIGDGGKVLQLFHFALIKPPPTSSAAGDT